MGTQLTLADKKPFFPLACAVPSMSLFVPRTRLECQRGIPAPKSSLRNGGALGVLLVPAWLAQSVFGAPLSSLGGCELGVAALWDTVTNGRELPAALEEPPQNGKASISKKLPGFGGFSATSLFSSVVPVAGCCSPFPMDIGILGYRDIGISGSFPTCRQRRERCSSPGVLPRGGSSCFPLPRGYF